MNNKTCGECQWYDYHHLLCVVGGDVEPTDCACDEFIAKIITNGDKIRQKERENMSSRQFNIQQLDVIYHCVGCRALNVINQFIRENGSLYAYTASNKLTDLVQQLDKLIDVLRDIEELKKTDGGR